MKINHLMRLSLVTLLVVVSVLYLPIEWRLLKLAFFPASLITLGYLAWLTSQKFKQQEKGKENGI